MIVEVAAPFTIDPKLKKASGSTLCAIICRVVIENGAVKLIIGDHVGYHVEPNANGQIHVRQTGPVPVKAKRKAKAVEAP